MRLIAIVLAVVALRWSTGVIAADEVALLQPSPPVVRGFVGSPADAARMKQWGANVVRIFGMSRRGQIPLEEQLQNLRELGGVKAIVVAGMGEADWSDAKLEERFCNTWKDLSTRLLPYRDVIWGYDLVNEPLDRKQLPLPPKQWRSVALKIIETIRAVDDRMWIIYEVGPGGMFSGFENLEPLPDKRVIYSAHYYFPHDFTHAGVRTIAGTPLTEIMKAINVPYPVKARVQWELDILQKPPMSIPKEKCGEWNKDLQRLYLAPAVEFQKKYQVPIYVGEFSAVSWAPVDSLVRYLTEAIELFEDNGWSWSYHAFGGGYPGWNPELPEGPEHYEELQKNPKPSGVETRRMKLLKEALKKNADGETQMHSN